MKKADPLSSLKKYYGDKKLASLTASWINQYSPAFSDDKLLSLFEKTFNESASYFDISENVKDVAEKLMVNYYHNEAFVKSELVEFLKQNNAVSFFELPVCDSRIDVCSINGTSCAYEIKTKYDSLKRLPKQLLDYLSVIEYVFVVCSEDKQADVLSIVPECVGVYVYEDSRKKVAFKLIKKAKMSPLINANNQFYILRQSERTNISFALNQKENINSYFKECLKQRYRKKWDAFCKRPKNLNRLDYQYYFGSI